ncbi:hypothetical protein ACFQS3_09995 [Glycomyces mayteni]|uniref:CorA-like Mg2+ transporter protein n=1 Tax=Glycomyces mayteni TaxID=543887 RepID=A0ABW2D9Q8_9ACTN
MLDWLFGRSSGHDAVLPGATVHFTFTTSIGRSLNLERASRQLLQSDVAIAAAWPSETGIRLTPALARLDRRAERLQRLYDDIARARTTSQWARFMVKHPVVAARSLKTAWTSEPERSEEGPSGPEGDRVDSEVLDTARAVSIDAQKVSLVEREISADLFGGMDQDEDRYVRLCLRSSYHQVEPPFKGHRPFDVAFEPRLLLHESGVVQLTIALPIKAALTARELSTMSIAKTPCITMSTFPEPLLAGLRTTRRRPPLGTWLEDLDAGARLREMSFDQPCTIEDVLGRHLEAIGATIGYRLPQSFNIYATVMTAAGRCCNSHQEWKRAHRSELRTIAARWFGEDELSDNVDEGRDYSSTRSSSLHLNLASALHITWRGKPPSPMRELYTVLVIEYGMLLYWRLAEIERRAPRLSTGDRALTVLYRDIIQLFAELRQGSIRYGSARDISRSLIRHLGGDDMRAVIETSLSLGAQAYAAKRAATDARRSLGIALLGAIIAALVAVPVLSDLLDGAQGEAFGGFAGVLYAPIEWAAGLGPWGPWAILGLAFTAGAVVWLAPIALKATTLRLPRLFRRRGSFTAPPNVQFTIDDDDA